MRRATGIIALLLLATTLIAPKLWSGAEVVSMIDGIALLDYSHKPNFHVGDWVQYHVLGHSEMGMKDDYVVTMMIGGEERFWGDDGFWLETWTDRKGARPVAIASLMSYSVYDDSLAVTHAELYARKMVTTADADGNPIQNIRKRVEGSLKVRETPEMAPVWHFDTLGTDTVMTPKGNYNCVKIRRRWGVGANGDQGDSTVRTEVEESHITYYARGVPLARMVREDIEKWIRRKSWKVGRSQDAPMRTMEHTMAVARLVDFGTKLTPRMTPEWARTSLKKSSESENRPPAERRKSPPRKRSG